MAKHVLSSDSGNPPDTPKSEQWATLLRHGPSRHQDGYISSTIIGKPDIRAHHAINEKDAGLGDDLPHMPERIFTAPPSSDNSAPQNSNSDSGTAEKYNTIPQDSTGQPIILHSDKAVLVDRELQRLREKRPMELRMRWRVLTGTIMLLVLSLTTYCMAQCIIAYLSLSPSTWVLSEAQNGTQTSPDSLLRTLSLIEIVCMILAALGCLSSGLYLRMTRRRSCGQKLIWISAITATTINLTLSLLNIALIVAWHRHYGSNTSSPYAMTRDVGQRCRGTWDMDILWKAAENSSIAKPDDKNHYTACQRDPESTVKAYLIAGGTRLGLFAALCTIWLACLARYNKTLTLHLSSTDSIEESPEMLKLLDKDEDDLPAMPELQDSIDIPGKYYEDSYRDTQAYGRARTYVEASPTIAAFDWQKRSGTSDCRKDKVVAFNNLASERHVREQSAGAWSKSIIDRVWDAIANDDSTRSKHDNMSDSGVDTFLIDRGQHQRDHTNLGIRGWFRRGSSIGSVESEKYEEQMTAERFSSLGHARTSSQERRQREDRHAASRMLYEEALRPDATLKMQSASSGAEVKGSKLYKNLRQTEAELSGNLEGEEYSTISSHDRNPFASNGDHLPHMPRLSVLSSDATQLRDEGDKASLCSSHVESAAPKESQPVFVRTLGKLVRTLSAIESVGSGEQSSRRSQSHASRERSFSNIY